MKYKRLFLRLSNETLHNLVQRYHYEEQEHIIYEVYNLMKKKIRPALYYTYDYYGQDESLFIFTLGKEIDDLQLNFKKTGEIGKAYAMNCLSMEFLTEGYGQIEEIVKRERRQFLREMVFLDTEDVEDYLPLVPKQTVIIRGITGEQCGNQKLHDCSRCTLVNCMYRKEEL